MIPVRVTSNKPPKPPKYKNIKTVVDGIEFDSKREANRYLILKRWQSTGMISELNLQVPFVLLPAQYRDGVLIEHSCKYVADFTYLNKSGNFVVEDAKGHATTEYKVKRKLMLFINDIIVREV